MTKIEKASWLKKCQSTSISNSSSAPIPISLIYWRNPSEWAQLIYNYVEKCGGIGSIFTVYDLIEGDDTIKEGKNSN